MTLIVCEPLGLLFTVHSECMQNTQDPLIAVWHRQGRYTVSSMTCDEWGPEIRRFRTQNAQ